MNIGFISLGCAKNQVDSEEILSYLKRNGFEIVSDPELSDIIIVNTCAFIEQAKVEAIRTILDMTTYKKPLIVIGCMAQRYYEELKQEIPEIDLIIPIEDYSKFGERLKELLPNYNIHNLKTFMDIVKICNKELLAITCPTLIIWGKLDQLVPYNSVKYLYDISLNKKELVVYDDISHLMLLSENNQKIIDKNNNEVSVCPTPMEKMIIVLSKPNKYINLYCIARTI